MKYFKQLICFAIGMLMSFPAIADDKEVPQLDISHVVLEHIKDSYEWHVTDIGEKSVVIHLPVIVHSSTGWHIFSSSQFEHHADANGYRQGPYGLVIPTTGDNAGKIVELLPGSGEEKRPFDISITKTVATMFISVFVLLLCILIPARWYRHHKARKDVTAILPVMLPPPGGNGIRPIILQVKMKKKHVRR